MRRNRIFTDKEAEFLRELVRQKVDFMIVGLAAAALQGAPVVTQDVDLWFANLAHPGIRRALQKVGAAYVPCFGMNPPMFAGDSVDLFDIVLNMHWLEDFCREKKHTLKIPLGRFKIPVLGLERIICSKRAAGRPKDKLVIPVLEDVLATISAKSRPRKPRRKSAGKASGVDNRRRSVEYCRNIS